MHKKILSVLLIVLAIFAVARVYNLTKITGFGTLTGITVGIQENLNGKLLLVYSPVIQFGNSENITAEFVNTGTIPVTTKIEISVQGYINGSMKPLAHYYDSTVTLQPGMRRSYTTVFIPSSTGLYYIQAKASYENRISEVWGVFSVYTPPPQTITIITAVVGPGAVAAAAPPPSGVVGNPKMNLTYPDSVKVYQGGSTLFNITVNNVGDVTLHNLKVYVSTTDLINFVVSPKIWSLLYTNRSTIFLISLEAPANTTEGSYAFDFEIMSDETKEGQIITVEVMPPPLSIEEDVKQDILNYGFLITKIAEDINTAAAQGFDVHMANNSLNNARTSLEIAKNYFNQKRFDIANVQLVKTKGFLEDAVFQLASTTMYLYKPPAFSPWLIFLIIILIVIVILIIFYWRKDRKKRPKLLKEMIETTTET
jgi:hypothetical protein